MTFALDHVFILCAPGAPEAEALVCLGLKEGSPNVHPGQGTANRRFFFKRGFLELAWVSDADEARREPALRTRLWERWSQRGQGACPFGLVFSTAPGDTQGPPFETWPYQPSYSPVPIDIAVGTPLREPELFHFRISRPPGGPQGEPTGHALPLKDLTAVSVGIPGPPARSAAASRLEATGLVTFPAAEAYVLALSFDGAGRGQQADLRPGLPLVLRW